MRLKKKKTTITEVPKFYDNEVLSSSSTMGCGSSWEDSLLGDCVASEGVSEGVSKDGARWEGEDSSAVSSSSSSSASSFILSSEGSSSSSISPRTAFCKTSIHLQTMKTKHAWLTHLQYWKGSWMHTRETLCLIYIHLDSHGRSCVGHTCPVLPIGIPTMVGQW